MSRDAKQRCGSERRIAPKALDMSTMGVDGVREDFGSQTWLLQVGMRYLTGGSDVGYILSAGRADVSGCARCAFPRMP